MIRKLNQILNKLCITNVVCEDSAKQLLHYKYNIRIVHDSRSATFEALGIAKMTDERIALIVDELYLSNIYTAITEVWFQRINILIITINANLYQSQEYMERCIVGKAMLIGDSKVENIIENILEQSGPFLLRTAITLNIDVEIDYSKIYNKLNAYLSSEDIVSFFNPIDTGFISKAKVRVIKPGHKYGIISKYVGYLLGCSNNRHILCIPESLLSYDSNIFNFRNIPNNFCIIVIADESGLVDRLSSWISSNTISCQTATIADNIEFKDQKEIIYFKG